MGELGIGQILLIAGFIVVLLVKTVLQQARRRSGVQIPEEEPVMRIRSPARASPEPRAPRSLAREPQAPNVHPPPGGSHSIRKSLLETPHDVQRGIILMTILGPCRAFDPPD